jgi:phosphoribosylaminoimidazole (AIR) synthetase
MLHCQDVGGITSREAYRAWNMGNGMVVVTPEPESVIKVAARHGVEAKVIGEVREKPGITIRNMAPHDGKDGLLEFPA